MFINQAMTFCTTIHCGEFAFFGKEDNGVLLHCKKHKEDGETDFIFKVCKNDNDKCNRTAYYGIEKNEPIHCYFHSLKGYLDVVNALCNKCKTRRQHMAHIPKCKRCHDDDIETKTTARRHKEYAFCDRLIVKYPDLHFKFDLQLTKKNYRPDIFITFDDHYIIIEIDENGHIGYKNEVERMESIQKFLIKPTLFIRFNPDSFKNHEGTHYFSLFKDGKIRNIDEFDKRFNVLCKILEKNLIISLDRVCQLNVEHVFYNNFNYN